MDSTDRLQWFADNVDFFESILDDDLSQQVPTCPGWSIHDLLTHLSFGLGVCYPVAASTPPETPVDAVFAEVDRSDLDLDGSEAVAAFKTNMRDCLRALRSMDPAAECWTYAGPGVVSFWVQRAACETAIHRYDAERAVGTPPSLAPERAADGIDETLEFALPFASMKIGAPSSELRLVATDSTLERSIGTGEERVTITGDGYSLLLALWGRSAGHCDNLGNTSVTISQQVAGNYLTSTNAMQDSNGAWIRSNDTTNAAGVSINGVSRADAVMIPIPDAKKSNDIFKWGAYKAWFINQQWFSNPAEGLMVCVAGNVILFKCGEVIDRDRDYQSSSTGVNVENAFRMEFTVGGEVTTYGGASGAPVIGDQSFSSTKRRAAGTHNGSFFDCEVYNPAGNVCLETRVVTTSSGIQHVQTETTMNLILSNPG